MKTNFKSSPRVVNSLYFIGAALIVSSACSEEPMAPEVRKSSSCFVTSVRTARKAVYFCSRSAASDTSGSCHQVCVKMVSSLAAYASVPAKTAHASSAVNDRAGAIRRSRLCVMCHRAVCAERRACDVKPEVYRRSFRISR